MLIRENTVSAPPLMFFLEFIQNFQNSYVKEQLYDHAVSTIEERDGLLKDLIRSALKFSNT